jgi:hypothetical protein
MNCDIDVFSPTGIHRKFTSRLRTTSRASSKYDYTGILGDKKNININSNDLYGNDVMSIVFALNDHVLETYQFQHIPGKDVYVVFLVVDI